MGESVSYAGESVRGYPYCPRLEPILLYPPQSALPYWLCYRVASVRDSGVFYGLDIHMGGWRAGG